MTLQELLLILQSVASAAMCGIIWFVQIVHYPLFAASGDDRAYARENQRRTRLVVLPFMLVEAVTAAAIAWNPPPGVPRPLAIVGLALVAALAVSTALLQMPLHRRFTEEGHLPRLVAALVRSNWLRTLLWTARAALAAWMLHAPAAARHME